MKVTLKQFFNLGDEEGRLSTSMSDVYEMLSYIFSENFESRALPIAMDRLSEINPLWFSDAVSVIDEIKRIENTNDFAQIMKAIDFGYSDFTVTLGKVESDFSLLDGLV